MTEDVLLPAFEAYRARTEALLAHHEELSEFDHAFKNDPEVRRLRQGAREEMGALYDQIRNEFAVGGIARASLEG